MRNLAAILSTIVVTSYSTLIFIAFPLFAEPLFHSRQLTPSGEYTRGIEGPAVDASGTLYVANFKNPGMIGMVASGSTKSALFAVLPSGSIGNGIRFDREGRMFVADFKKHNVFVLDRGHADAHVYFHSNQFYQPNDIAVSADGTLYASDPSFQNRRGQIWRITRAADGRGYGEIMSSERRMGVANGIDLSVDETTLYLSESDTREVWAYRLHGATLTSPRLIRRFSAFELDGLRTDLDGRIFVTRPGHGTVAVLAPDGTLVREISLLGKEPTNLTFGGVDGKTVFITQADGRFIEWFRADRPGREPCLQVPKAC